MTALGERGARLRLWAGAASADGDGFVEDGHDACAAWQDRAHGGSGDY